MIAAGELPVPVDWDPEQLQPLLDLLHIASRRRLMSFVARIVANDIHAHECNKEELHD